MRLAKDYARLSIHVFASLNHFLGKYRTNWNSVTMSSPMLVVKPWCLLPPYIFRTAANHVERDPDTLKREIFPCCSRG